MNILIILAIVILAGVLFNYNRNKGLLNESLGENKMMNENIMPNPSSENKLNSIIKNTGLQPSEPQSSGPQPSSDNNNYLNVKGMSSSKPVNTCVNQPMMDPKELLPSDNNNEWSDIKPNTELKDIHMLNAGHHVGVNTVGSSLRNPNLQLRSEPVIPQKNLGPWNNSTMEPDNLRRPLEIGNGE